MHRKKHKKDKEIIELIAHSLGDAAFAGSFKPSKVVGHIHHDISDNSYKYSITDLEGMRFILSFCKKHHLHTLKQVDVNTLTRLVSFIYAFSIHLKRVPPLNV